MTLTPADVHAVAFKKPPIGKRGYDEEEVDEFLDKVEEELARLIEENNHLRATGGAPSAPVEAPRGDDGASATELAAAHDENNRLKVQVNELQSALSQGSDQTQHQLVALQNQLAQTEQQLNESRQQLQAAQQAAHEAQQQAVAAQQQAAAAAQNAPAAEQPAGEQQHTLQAVQMLALAQQTADTHLAQSKAEAERLVSEAQANASQTVNSARAQSEQHVAEAQATAKKLNEDSTAKAQQTVSDAEQRAATITAQFEQRKEALERRVEQLRTFEREYRTRLKSYLESQLRDLDASGRAEPPSQGHNDANNNQPARQD
ncbi:DivIVA domain-containing protein [Jatrophihabitans sp. GAS493]|uniref:DivIVA domain-containing protein n=1 Tax=Jatrophihabitans sp. GAS493 TaxID=1907575 RepID=UPI000BB74AAB|nr:DivIVA domain-containing protein [Jatrophihabitans sp. GAS493]SOD74315.1 DivIVA domain-containing protein [Jatrophihabitans sp. GAS493]